MRRRSKGLGRLGFSLGWLLCLGCDGGDGGGRAQAMKAAGATLGFDYAQDLPQDLDEVFRSMPSVVLRDRNYFTNVLASGDELVFDWTWRGGRIKDRTRVKQTIVALRRPGGDLPGFVWAERASLSAAELRAFGGTLDFDGVRSFSDRFDVAGRKRAEIRKLFSEQSRGTMELPVGLRVEAIGDWIIGYRPGVVTEPGELDIQIKEVRRATQGL